VPSALLCFAEELLLGRAAERPFCPLAMQSLHFRGPAQLRSRGPAQQDTFSALSGLPSHVPGAPREPTVKQAETVMGILSLGWERHLAVAVAFFLSAKVLAQKIIFSCPVFRQHSQNRAGRDLHYPC